jgi:hypothetical protein
MNEEEKKAIERLKEIEINTYAEGKARTIDTILNLIAKLQKENEEWQRAYQEEKDKQIDLMAEAMRYYNGMQQEQEFCIEICEKKECNIEKCKECIKQYFENKAKELLNK